MSSFPYRCTVHVEGEQDRHALLSLLGKHHWIVQIHPQAFDERRVAIDFAKNAEWHAFEAHLVHLGHGEHRLAH